ncbi:helix-hairpin-helix domain-containing protein [Nocardiopsis sp. NPDC006938]|uniref:helix-hairpin-helix domain-containing protein n=1 Tax=Nocardiopsis sp. NPDC006938 TaxID=3364337 RepID=UPI0036CC0884
MANASPGPGWHPGDHDPRHRHHGHAERQAPPHQGQPGPAHHPHHGPHHGPTGPQGHPPHHGQQAPPPPAHPQPSPKAGGDILPGGTGFLLTNLLSCGALSVFAFAYVAVRHRSGAAGVLALLILPLLAVFGASAEDSVLENVSVGVLIVYAFVATAYLFHDVYNANSKRNRRLRGEPAERPEAGPAPASAAGARTGRDNAELRAMAADRARRREESRALLRDEPVLARELGIGRPDLDTGYDDGGLVDLNRASAEAIASLPGLTPEHARTLVEARAAAPFVSLPDALIRSGLPAHLEDDVSGYVVF